MTNRSSASRVLVGVFKYITSVRCTHHCVVTSLTPQLGHESGEIRKWNDFEHIVFWQLSDSTIIIHNHLKIDEIE